MKTNFDLLHSFDYLLKFLEKCPIFNIVEFNLDTLNDFKNDFAMSEYEYLKDKIGLIKEKKYFLCIFDWKLGTYFLVPKNKKYVFEKMFSIVHYIDCLMTEKEVNRVFKLFQKGFKKERERIILTYGSLFNLMCTNCALLNRSCSGEKNRDYTNCIFKVMKNEKEGVLKK